MREHEDDTPVSPAREALIVAVNSLVHDVDAGRSPGGRLFQGQLKNSKRRFTVVIAVDKWSEQIDALLETLSGFEEGDDP